jgi:hypothetical protein
MSHPVSRLLTGSGWLSCSCPHTTKSKNLRRCRTRGLALVQYGHTASSARAQPSTAYAVCPPHGAAPGNSALRRLRRTEMPLRFQPTHLGRNDSLTMFLAVMEPRATRF